MTDGTHAQRATAGMANSSGQLSVFISYSRDDLDFADQLSAALGLHDFEVTIDRHGISGGEDWKSRLGSLIRDADTVVFVLSPSSARSEICRWEVEEAVRLGKRIIPVPCRPLEGVAPPERLSGLNYIHFYAEPRSPGSGFGSGLVGLVTALNTDLDWLREHTRLLQRATEWEAGGRPANRLLSGGDVAAAKAWMARRPREAPEPTALHLDFILASETSESERQSEDRRRLDERERLVRGAEAAQKERDAATARVVRRTMGGLVAALVLSTVALVFGYYALVQKGEAERQATLAEKSAAEATGARNEALLNQSKFLSDLSRKETEQGDAGAGLLLAIEAMRDETSTEATRKSRPVWPPAQVSLDIAMRALREVRLLRGHEMPVLGVAVSPDSTHIASASVDETLRIWEARSGALVRILRHDASLSSVAYTPDGRRLVTGTSDGTVRVWDVGTGETLMVRTFPSTVFAVAVSPDGGRIAVATGELVDGGDNTVRIIDAGTGALLQDLRGGDVAVLALAYTPDGRVLVTGIADGNVRIWDTETGAPLGSLPGHSGTVFSVAVSPDGDRIVTGSGDLTARVWSLRTRAELMVLKGHANPINSVKVTPDGRRVVTAGGSIIGSGDNTVRVWDIETGKEELALRGHDLGVGSVAVSPDGTMIVSVSNDKTVRIWDPRPGDGERVLAGHSSNVQNVAVSPDGSRIASASLDQTVRIWDAVTGEPGASLKHQAGVFSIAWLPDGNRLASGSTDGTVQIWDTKSGQPLKVLKHANPVISVAVSADGRWVASATGLLTEGGENLARLWDVETGDLVREFKGHRFAVLSVAISADGAHLVTGSADSTIKVWSTRTGAELRTITGHQGAVFGVTISPDGRKIVSGSGDLTARVWDLASGAQLQVMRGHANPINSVRVTPDGTRVLTAGGSSIGSGDNTVRMWDLATGIELLLLRGHQSAVTSVAIAPDGRWVVSSANDRTARIWTIGSAGQGQLDDAKRLAPRCLSAQLRDRFFLSAEQPEWCASQQKWPYDTTSVIAEAAALARGDDAAAATAAFDRVRRADPKAADAIKEAWLSVHLFRGKVALHAGRNDEAAAAFAKAREADPTATARIERGEAYSRLLRGVTLLRDGRDAEAAAHLDVVRQRAPQLAKAIDVYRGTVLFDRARQLWTRGDRAVAEKALEEAAALDATARTRVDHLRAQSFNSRAWETLLKGRPAEALADAERGVALTPTNASLLDTRGQIYAALGRAGEAIVDLDKAITGGISIASSYVARGRAHEARRNFDLAIADYRQALDMDADDEYEKRAHAVAQDRLKALGQKLDQKVPR